MLMQATSQNLQDKTSLKDMASKPTRRAGQSIRQLIHTLKMQQKMECSNNCFYMTKDMDGEILIISKTYLVTVK